MPGENDPAPELTEQEENALFREYVFSKIRAPLELVFVGGKLTTTADNVQPLLKMLGINPGDETVLDLIRDALIDNMGIIEPKQLDELIGGFLHVSEEDDHECVQAAFNVIDQNGDGFLTGPDLYGTLLGLGVLVTEVEILQIMDTLDLDGDGWVTLRDFKELLLGKEAAAKEFKKPVPVISLADGEEEKQDAASEGATATDASLPATPREGEASTADTPRSQEGSKSDADSPRPPATPSKPVHAKRRSLFSYATAVKMTSSLATHSYSPLSSPRKDSEPSSPRLPGSSLVSPRSDGALSSDRATEEESKTPRDSQPPGAADEGQAGAPPSLQTEVSVDSGVGDSVSQPFSSSEPGTALAPLPSIDTIKEDDEVFDDDAPNVTAAPVDVTAASRDVTAAADDVTTPADDVTSADRSPRPEGDRDESAVSGDGVASPGTADGGAVRDQGTQCYRGSDGFPADGASPVPRLALDLEPDTEQPNLLEGATPTPGSRPGTASVRDESKDVTSLAGDAEMDASTQPEEEPQVKVKRKKKKKRPPVERRSLFTLNLGGDGAAPEVSTERRGSMASSEGSVRLTLLSCQDPAGVCLTSHLNLTEAEPRFILGDDVRLEPSHPRFHDDYLNTEECVLHMRSRRYPGSRPSSRLSRGSRPASAALSNVLWRRLDSASSSRRGSRPASANLSIRPRSSRSSARSGTPQPPSPAPWTCHTLTIDISKTRGVQTSVFQERPLAPQSQQELPPLPLDLLSAPPRRRAMRGVHDPLSEEGEVSRLGDSECGDQASSGVASKGSSNALSKAGDSDEDKMAELELLRDRAATLQARRSSGLRRSLTETEILSTLRRRSHRGDKVESMTTQPPGKHVLKRRVTELVGPGATTAEDQTWMPVVDLTDSLDREPLYRAGVALSRKHTGFKSIATPARVLSAHRSGSRRRVPRQFSSLSRRLETDGVPSYGEGGSPREVILSPRAAATKHHEVPITPMPSLKSEGDQATEGSGSLARQARAKTPGDPDEHDRSRRQSGSPDSGRHSSLRSSSLSSHFFLRHDSHEDGEGEEGDKEGADEEEEEEGEADQATPLSPRLHRHHRSALAREVIAGSPRETTGSRQRFLMSTDSGLGSKSPGSVYTDISVLGEHVTLRPNLHTPSPAFQRSQHVAAQGVTRGKRPSTAHPRPSSWQTRGQHSASWDVDKASSLLVIRDKQGLRTAKGENSESKGDDSVQGAEQTRGGASRQHQPRARPRTGSERVLLRKARTLLDFGPDRQALWSGQSGQTGRTPPSQPTLDPSPSQRQGGSTAVRPDVQCRWVRLTARERVSSGDRASKSGWRKVKDSVFSMTKARPRACSSRERDSGTEGQGGEERMQMLRQLYRRRSGEGENLLHDVGGLERRRSMLPGQNEVSNSLAGSSHERDSGMEGQGGEERMQMLSQLYRRRSREGEFLLHDGGGLERRRSMLPGQNEVSNSLAGSSHERDSGMEVQGGEERMQMLSQLYRRRSGEGESLLQDVGGLERRRSILPGQNEVSKSQRNPRSTSQANFDLSCLSPRSALESLHRPVSSRPSGRRGARQSPPTAFQPPGHLPRPPGQPPNSPRHAPLATSPALHATNPAPHASSPTPHHSQPHFSLSGSLDPESPRHIPRPPDHPPTSPRRTPRSPRRASHSPGHNPHSPRPTPHSTGPTPDSPRHVPHPPNHPPTSPRRTPRSPRHASHLPGDAHQTTSHTPHSPRHAPHPPNHAPHSPRHAHHPPSHAPHSPRHAPHPPDHAPHSPRHAHQPPSHTPHSPRHAPHPPGHAPHSPRHAHHPPSHAPHSPRHAHHPPGHTPRSPHHVSLIRCQSERRMSATPQGVVLSPRA